MRKRRWSNCGRMSWALEKSIQESIEQEQLALELENQNLMNDKKNALELESKEMS